MTKLVTSITIYLLCARSVFPYKLKSVRNNASTFQDFVNKEVSEGNIVDPKLINYDLLHAEKGASKSSTNLKRSDRDNDNHWFNFGKFYVWRLIGNVNRYINTNKGSVGKPYLQTSRKTDQEVNNILMGTYNYYNTRNHLEELQNEDPSRVSEFPISHERGRKDICYNYKDCQEYLKSSTCVISLYGNKCECHPNYVPGYRECLPKRNIGESCKLIVQCPERSKCVNGICKCNDRFIRKYDQCVRTLVGYSCKDLRECPKWGLCKNGQCVCREDYDTRNGICVSKFIGGICEETAKCPLLGVCEAGTCVCKSGFIAKGLLCVKKSSGTSGWLWGIIVAAVGVVIICISAGLLIIRMMRNRTTRSGLHHNEPAVDSSSPETPPPSYENVCQPPIGNVVLPHHK